MAAPINHTKLRDMFADALHALEVGTVADPELSPEDTTAVLAGALAFRFADLACPATNSADTTYQEERDRFSQGWNNLRTASTCDDSEEATVLAVLIGLLTATARDNAAKRHNPYAKAAAFALEAASALMFLASDPDHANPAEVAARAGARITADEQLTHAHAWLAHLRSTS
jgi:hypothetical protein